MELVTTPIPNNDEITTRNASMPLYIFTETFNIPKWPRNHRKYFYIHTYACIYIICISCNCRFKCKKLRFCHVQHDSRPRQKKN